MSQALIADVTAENFQQVVVDNSHKIPVLVDFWADWCGPCKAVMPILEKLATEMAGKFLLAKVNTETEEALANQFAIRSLPSFKIYKDGEVVQELSGALSEEAFREILGKYIENPSEELRQQAQLAFSQGNIQQTLELLNQAAQIDPTNFKVHLDLVQMYIQTGHLDEAQNLMSKLPDEAQESAEGKAMAGFLYFAVAANEAGDIQDIQKTLQENPNDLDAIYGFASILVVHHEYEKAMQAFLKLYTLDASYKDGIAQKSLIKLFDQLAEVQPELVKDYRRKFQNLIY